MKKYMICFCGLLAACATSTGAGSGLTRLTQEPKDCTFLYTMTSDITNYSKEDVYNYLEQKILNQQKVGDSYYIVKESVIDNIGAIFGPKQTYNLKVKVYNCQK
ncbi:MAG: hypothetical protein IJL05_05095 [Alphaproteobacteria bacterium]|nr:hypothetical protein [Alphaproteobacteria bacterium]